MLVVLFASHIVLGSNPGVSFGVSQELVDYSTEVCVPLLQEGITDIKIPDIIDQHDDSFVWSLMNFRVTSCTIGGAKGSFAADKGVEFGVSSFQIVITADYQWHNHVISSWKGSGSVVVTALGSLSTLVLLLVNAGRVVAQHGGSRCSLTNLDFDFSGSLFDGLYELLTKLFKGNISRDVENDVQKALDKGIDTDLNQAIAKINPIVPLQLDAPLTNLTADFSALDVSITSQLFTLNSRGCVYDTSDTHACSEPAPPLAPIQTVPKMLSITLSPYVVNSGAASAFRMNQLEYLLTAADVSSLAVNPLNTDSMNGFCPDLIHYRNRNMTVLVTATSVPAMQIDPTAGDQPKAAITADVELAFSMPANNGTNATIDAFTLGCGLRAEAVAWLTGEVVHGNISLLSCNLTLKETHYEPFLTSYANETINTLMKLMIAKVNKDIGKGLSLPTDEDVSLVNSSLVAVGDATLQVQTNLVYKPHEARKVHTKGSVHRSSKLSPADNPRRMRRDRDLALTPTPPDQVCPVSGLYAGTTGIIPDHNRTYEGWMQVQILNSTYIHILAFANYPDPEHDGYNYTTRECVEQAHCDGTSIRLDNLANPSDCLNKTMEGWVQVRALTYYPSIDVIMVEVYIDTHKGTVPIGDQHIPMCNLALPEALCAKPPPPPGPPPPDRS